jgi:hypothetical protein
MVAAKQPLASPPATPPASSSCSWIFSHPDYDRRPWVYTSVCLAARGARAGCRLQVADHSLEWLHPAACRLSPAITAGRDLHPAPKILLNSARIALRAWVVKLFGRPVRPIAVASEALDSWLHRSRVHGILAAWSGSNAPALVRGTYPASFWLSRAARHMAPGA